MRKWFCLLMCTCMLVVAYTSCISEHEEETSETDIKVGDMIPEFSLLMSDGQAVDRETLRGKPSCIVFFNTSCGDCRSEFPVLEKVYETYGASGFVNFVLVSREEEEASISAYWDANGLSMPYSAQADRVIYNLFATSVIPRIYIADASLQVKFVYTDSPLATEEDLSTAFRTLLP